jgi:hypothetical protein
MQWLRKIGFHATNMRNTIYCTPHVCGIKKTVWGESAQTVKNESKPKSQFSPDAA